MAAELPAGVVGERVGGGAGGLLSGAPRELEAGSQLGTGDLHRLDLGGVGVGRCVCDDRDPESLGGEGDERLGV